MADGCQNIRPEQRAHFATPTPVTLRTALELVGGYRGTLRNPVTKTMHEVDLTSYEGADLDTTLLMISMRSVDPAKVGTKRADYI